VPVADSGEPQPLKTGKIERLPLKTGEIGGS
jgi:hypothetical protein